MQMEVLDVLAKMLFSFDGENAGILGNAEAKWPLGKGWFLCRHVCVRE